MNCRRCKKIINLIYDQRISDNELNAVLFHIGNCDDCRKHYYTVKNMVEDLGQINEEPLPEGFENKLHFALKREVNTPIDKVGRLNKRLKVALGAVAGIILLAGAVTILPNFAFKSDYAMEAPNMMKEMVMDEVQVEETAEEEMMMEDGYSGRGEESSLFEESAPAEASNKAVDQEEPADVLQGVIESEDIVDYTCNDLLNGDSVVITIDVEDTKLAQSAISEYIPNLLETEGWVLHIEEPEKYLSIRSLGDFEEIGIATNRVIREYSEYVTNYYIARVEYENYNTELEGLQNTGYIYVIIK